MRRRNSSSLVMLVIAAILVACSASDVPVGPRIAPSAPRPLLSKIKATDSMMVITDVTYSDTASTIAWLAPVRADTSVSAVIGPDGGELRIDALGASITVPKYALSANTTITMTVLHGPVVAYDFQPHGIVFARPVSIRQSLAGTAAEADPSILGVLHGAYFDRGFDSSFVDVAHTRMKVRERELGYLDPFRKRINFFVGHFSGYIVAMGRSGEMR